MDAQLLPTTYLVGDRFETFARKDRVETVNRFVGNVRSGLFDRLVDPMRLVAGQGVDASDWDTVRTELSRRGLLDRFVLPARLPAAVPAADVHKQQEENVLLADVAASGPLALTARLRLSDRNELVTDHVTGQHLSGMVLIEAGRQMILAGTHEFVLTPDTEPDFSFVLGSLSVAFERYVFPIGAELALRLTKLPSSKPARLEFTAEVEVTQSGEVAARISAEFQVVRTRGLARQEEMLATKAIEACGFTAEQPVGAPARQCSSAPARRAAARVPQGA
ncbi:AfsA-related hotdog domain-containing protein [Actinokineospora sp. NBRC 105648]|uniref:AfsA-related hotdog domain-containing protein n=1 Tax=Actinokineospora sp. NBRC 105648 TaxID=3032206 RepID=UPI0024A17663|nr:AfsA-related hotdog domain-containing protein [Actinokineospora sp. NBRC 105648]GLZ39221.1 hypothetical protein Acsp05_28450 [Actinokineospora sp. NBRC 105648]